MLFKVVFFPGKEHFIFEGGLEVRAYFDAEEKTVFVAGSRLRLAVYFHECFHAVRARILPECIGLYLDILFDLFTTFFISSCYTNGIITSLKETWKDYRIQGCATELAEDEVLKEDGVNFEIEEDDE